MDQTVQPRVIIIHDNKDFNETFINFIIASTNALVVKLDIDVLKINELINVINPNFIVVYCNTLNNECICKLKRVRIEVNQNCKIVFLTHIKPSNSKMPLSYLSQTKNIEQPIDTVLQHEKHNNNDWIGMPINTGLRIVNKNDIVLFKYTNRNQSKKDKWEAMLNSSEIFQLRINITSKDIAKYFSNHEFIQINQRFIINIKFLKTIEIKTYKCILYEPYDNMEIYTTRSYLNEIKARFNI